MPLTTNFYTTNSWCWSSTCYWPLPSRHVMAEIARLLWDQRQQTPFGIDLRCYLDRLTHNYRQRRNYLRKSTTGSQMPKKMHWINVLTSAFTAGVWIRRPSEISWPLNSSNLFCKVKSLNFTFYLAFTSIFQSLKRGSFSRYFLVKLRTVLWHI